MPTKRDDTTKKKGERAVLPVLLGGGLALAGFLLLLLAVAGLMALEVLPADSPSFLLSACAGLWAFLGGRWAVRQGSLAPMVSGGLTGVLLCLILLLPCCWVRGAVAFPGPFAGTLLMVLAGGCLAGLLGKRKPRKKKR